MKWCLKEILLKIDASHYVKSEQSTNADYSDDTVHIFKINEDLMPRFNEESDYVNICIYIKVTWPDGADPMFIISFHKDEE